MRRTIGRLGFVAAAAVCLSLFSPSSSGLVFAQAPAAAVLSFEVATIKVARADTDNSDLDYDSDGVKTRNFTLWAMMKWAYGLSTGADDQILGAPTWVRSTPFDINAKPDEKTTAAVSAMSEEARTAALKAMLRSLLEDRFQLKVHMEDQPRSVLALVPAKGGAKLTPFVVCSSTDGGAPCKAEWQGLHGNQGHIEGQGATIEMLVSMLSVMTEIGGRTVVDETGLKGPYRFEMNYRPESAAVESAGPTLFSALQEQLGLRLETKKIPIKVLVVDQVRQPSAN